MGSDIFRVENLAKNFGKTEVLNNIDLEIKKGEIFAIMGPSGVGKTTFLRILNLFEKPTKGKISFKGILLDHESREVKDRARSKMSMIFQTPVVFNTSVFNNVAFGLNIRKEEKNIIEKKVRNALGLVGLDGKEKQNALTLSGGEAQRMAFARAVVYDPDVLLLDEPTANLDPVNVSRIEDIIKKIRDEQNTTIIMATHNIPQVRRIAHRVGILLNGELIEVNTKEKIFKNPEDERTASFINGDMIY